MFSKYHYLSSSHNNAANVFICMINDEMFKWWHNANEEDAQEYAQRVKDNGYKQ